VGVWRFRSPRRMMLLEAMADFKWRRKGNLEGNDAIVELIFLSWSRRI
jgi:hypothetical protein